MAKDTSEIVKELGLYQDFQTFYNENKEHMVFDTLAELLAELQQRKGLKKSHVIKNAELSEIYGDLDAVLDSIIHLQESLIGGEGA